MNSLPFYKCLADDTRLKILLLLTQYPSLCVCDLQQALDLSQPKISRHLAELRKCELVNAERRGKWMHYHLAPDLAAWKKEVLLKTLENANEYLSDCMKALPQSCCN